MQENYKNRLYKNYPTTHLEFTDGDNFTKDQWFNNYIKKNYLPALSSYNPKKVNVLEIGCNKGHLLAALYENCFINLWGIDLSPQDLKYAEKIVPNAKFNCIDAIDFLNAHTDKFDVIISKAVLEHIDKNKVIPFFSGIKNSLKEFGLVLIDVPNMDWLFASHERYMDFTHENGFTRDSLGQIMRQFFSSVTISPIEFYELSLIEKLKMKLGRFVLGKMLYWADPQGASNPIWARSILGIGKKNTVP